MHAERELGLYQNPGKSPLGLRSYSRVSDETIFGPTLDSSKFIVARYGNPRLRNTEIVQTRPPQKIKSVPNASIFLDLPASLGIVRPSKSFIYGIRVDVPQEFLIYLL